MAENTGLAIRRIYKRRNSLERQGIELRSVPRKGTDHHAPPAHFERRRLFEIANGTVVVFSDAHYLPDHAPAGHEALEQVVKLVCETMEQHIMLTAPDGSTRDWYVPAEPQVGWNLGYRKDCDEDGNKLPEPINPDGLIKYSGRDERTRKEDPFNFLQRVL
jgi:hypothetical protein